MLIDFSVDNYRAFNNEVNVDMIASQRTNCLDVHCAEVGRDGVSVNLLKTFALFGANSSGKSSFISAIKFVQNALKRGASCYSFECDDWCKDRAENQTDESNFYIRFSVGDNLYVYGFGVILDTGNVTHEYLGQLCEHEIVRCVFTREGEDGVVFGEDFDITTNEKKRLNVYANDIDSYRLFLSLAGSKTYNKEAKSYCIHEAYDWLTNNIITEDKLFDLCPHTDNGFLEVGKEMKGFDVGINTIEIAPITHKKSDIPLIERLKFGRKGESARFNYDELSHGTKRLFDLMGILMSDKEDVVYLVDDFGRDFHPLLTEHFLKVFYDKYKAKRVQFMFTTHEDSLLKVYTKDDEEWQKEFPGSCTSNDPFKFRRDEIWFADKGKNGAHIYPLDYFVATDDNKLRDTYLDRRYGGVGNFSTVWEFDRLSNDNEDEEKNTEESNT